MRFSILSFAALALTLSVSAVPLFSKRGGDIPITITFCGKNDTIVFTTLEMDIVVSPLGLHVDIDGKSTAVIETGATGIVTLSYVFFLAYIISLCSLKSFF